MNNIFDTLLTNLNKNSQPNNSQQNTYPNFNFSNKIQSNLINSILPLLFSGSGIPDVSSLSNSNPLLSSIFSKMQNKETQKKIESDKIDVSSLSKV